MKERVYTIVKHILFTGLILSSSMFLFAQTISPQKLPFSQICAGGPHPTNAGEVFNEYQAAFIVGGFPSGTTFFVELSDSSGSFAAPTPTTALPPLTGTPPDTATDKTLTFAVPTDLVGSSSYQLRVKSSTGFASQSFTVFGSVSAKAFPAYFKAFNGPFYINNQSSNVSICNGGTVTLGIDNPTPTVVSSSPANYPNLKYKWYNGASVVAGETGPALVVSTTGTYYVEIDYGMCTDANFRSQLVTVNIASDAVATITSTLGNSVCAEGAVTTLSTESGQSYQWFKNDVAIQGATSFQYQTNLAGVYSVAVNSGSCASTPSIDLEESQVESSINVSSLITIEEGQTRTVIATTDAVNPTYQWYRDGNVIAEASGSSYEVSAEGDYKVIITQTSGCSISNEFPFTVKYPFVDPTIVAVPNLISPNGDGINDTWIIPQEYISGTNTEVILFSSLGEIVLKTNDYLNNWPEDQLDFKNVNQVYYYIITPAGKKVLKGSITVIK